MIVTSSGVDHNGNSDMDGGRSNRHLIDDSNQSWIARFFHTYLNSFNSKISDQSKGIAVDYSILYLRDGAVSLRT